MFMGDNYNIPVITTSVFEDIVIEEDKCILDCDEVILIAIFHFLTNEQICNLLRSAKSIYTKSFDSFILERIEESYDLPLPDIMRCQPSRLLNCNDETFLFEIYRQQLMFNEKDRDYEATLQNHVFQVITGKPGTIYSFLHLPSLFLGKVNWENNDFRYTHSSILLKGCVKLDDVEKLKIVSPVPCHVTMVDYGDDDTPGPNILRFFLTQIPGYFNIERPKLVKWFNESKDVSAFNEYFSTRNRLLSTFLLTLKDTLANTDENVEKLLQLKSVSIGSLIVLADCPYYENDRKNILKFCKKSRNPTLIQRVLYKRIER